MQVGDTVDGRFRVERRVGQGGMGTVYRAMSLEDGQPVALKVLRDPGEDQVKRFRREIGVLGRLAHPTIVAYRGHGLSSAGELYLAMEWLDGIELAEKLQAGALSYSEAVTVTARTVEALGLSHAHGIIHRDIKPQNLFLPDGDVQRLKVLDFGLARFVDPLRHGHGSVLTRVGTVMGTPAYLSPEQARGDTLDHRTDLWSLGAVLFACLTGRPAFFGDNFMAVLAKIVAEPSPRPCEVNPAVPVALDVLVSRLLEKQVQDRPADAREVLGILRSMAAVVDQPPAPEKVPHVLTDHEQRLAAVVLAATGSAVDAAMSATWTPDEATSLRSQLAPFARLHDASLEVLGDGSVVATLEMGAQARQRVEAAAHLALALRAALPGVPVALATGRAVVGRGIPVGEAIDWAARRVATAREAGVMVDPITADLLRGNFELDDRGDAAVLLGRRDVGSTALLGRSLECVGRDRELGELHAAWQDVCSAGRARVLHVVGAPGLGKSRLVFEWQRMLSADAGAVRPLFLLAPGEAARQSSPLSLVGAALRGAWSVHSRDTAELARRKVRGGVGRVVEGAALAPLSAFLGELVGVRFEDDDTVGLAAARADAQLMADRMRGAFVQWLSLSAQARPVVIVIDDAHWADDASMSLLTDALDVLHASPLLVVALSRPELLERGELPFAKLQPRLLQLSPLSQATCEALARDALVASSRSAESARELAERCDGNPFFLEELVRARVFGRSSTVPETVAATVEAHLATLSGDARRALRAASVFGRPVPAWAIGSLTGLEGETLESAVSELRDASILVRAGVGSQAHLFAIRHALFREVAYATLTPEDRRSAHRRAADWLEVSGERDPNLLASHFEAGGDGERAAHWLLHAVFDALAGSDLEGAVKLADRGLSVGARGGVRSMLRLHQAEAHVWLGRLTDGLTCAEEALGTLPTGSSEWCAAVALRIEAGGGLGEDAGGDQLISQLVSVSGAGEPRSLALARAASSLILLGKLDAARLALDSVRFASGSYTSAFVHAATGLLALQDGSLAQALDAFGSASATFMHFGNQRWAVGAQTNVGFLLCELGRHAEASATLDAAVRGARALGIPYAALLAQQNLGRALAREGRLAEARQEEEAAVAGLQEAGDARLEAGGRCTLAEIALSESDLRRAELEARRAVVLSRPIDHAHAAALGVLATVLLAQGRSEDALAVAKEAHGLSLRQPMQERQALLYLAYARALRACGRRDEARAVVVAARDHLLVIADQLTEPSARARYLSEIPENAEIIAAAVAW